MTAFTKTLTETLGIADTLLLQRPYAFVTNAVRTSATTLLRLRRKPVRYVNFDLPPVFGHLEPGDIVYASHELIPEAATGTARYDAWRLIPLHVVEVHDPLTPARISVKCVDLREVYCSWWSPLQTDVGMTDDLNGIAMLDRGGGWETARAQVAYGQRPPSEDAYQEVLANNPVVDASGLQAEGGDDINYALNSTFSEGSSTTYTNWTYTGTGSAFIADWHLYTLIDANGFRRAPQITTTNAGEDSYMSQTVSAGTNLNFCYVRFYYSNGGAIDDPIIRIQRLDTSDYWRDSDGSWQGSVQDNVVTPKALGIAKRWVSKRMDFASAVTDVKIDVGHFSAASTQYQITQLQGVEFIDYTADVDWFAYRSPLPTKAAAVTRIRNLTGIINDSAVRVLSPTRGFVKMTVQPHWNHSGLNDGAEYGKILWSSDFDDVSNAEYLRCYYYRIDSGTGEWRFENGDGNQAILQVTGANLVTRDEQYVVACRWTSAAVGEFYGTGVLQTMDIWVDGVKGTKVDFCVDQLPNAKCKVYLGTSPNYNEAVSLDGHITNVTISDHCPSDDEILRI